MFLEGTMDSIIIIIIIIIIIQSERTFTKLNQIKMPLAIRYQERHYKGNVLRTFRRVRVTTVAAKSNKYYKLGV